MVKKLEIELSDTDPERLVAYLSFRTDDFFVSVSFAFSDLKVLKERVDSAMRILEIEWEKLKK